MSVKDFPNRSGHPVNDPETLIRWLDEVPKALNIDDHIAVTSPSTADEVDIFNVAAGKRRKVTLANLVALATVPANITCTSINFGQTSLSYYREGTWTPIDSSGAGLTLTVSSATYTRTGRGAFTRAFVVYPANASGAGATIGGLQFTVSTTTPGSVFTSSATAAGSILFLGTTTTLSIFSATNATAITNAQLSGANVLIAGTYEV